MSLLSSAKESVKTLKDHLGEEAYAILGYVTFAPPQKPLLQPCIVGISYELLDPWRPWSGGHRPVNSWAKVRTLVLASFWVSLSQTIIPRTFSQPTQLPSPSPAIMPWAAPSTPHAHQSSQPNWQKQQKSSHFLQFKRLKWLRGVKGEKGKQQELTAKHKETMQWRWKEKAFLSISHKPFTSLHGLPSCTSDKNKIPKISVHWNWNFRAF